jgi:hypothetical protein
VKFTLLPALIALAASVLLFQSLGEKYLWQDEANTAVLATRMLNFGRPLAYDGKNFVGLDDSSMEDSEPVELRSGSAQSVVDFYVRQGYVKSDTTWKWHPWGSFAVAAVSIAILGQTTLAARLPFALAGVLTVLLLYGLVVICCDSACRANRRIAQVSAALLTLNAYWILHDRQCRYYALSSLFLVLTLFGYSRWQSERKWGLTGFIAAAWCWFQVDYGTFWPVLLVVFADAFVAHRRTPWPVLRAGAVLTATVAPFVWYYELWGRHGLQEDTWWIRFRVNVFNTNEFVIPLLLLIAAIALLARRWNRFAPRERRTVAIACGVVLALLAWVPSMAPAPFLRYTIMAAPAGCFVAAWLIVRVLPRPAVWPAAAVLALTPWFALPLDAVIGAPWWYPGGGVIRPELSRLRQEVFGHTEDVNRSVIEWLRENARPSDEIVVNYEDLPLVYYLPNPVRGGIAAFRVEDDVIVRPRFLVMRPDIPFVDEDTFAREAGRYRWQPMSVRVTSTLWGNNPDPMSVAPAPDAGRMVILRRVD